VSVDVWMGTMTATVDDAPGLHPGLLYSALTILPYVMRPNPRRYGESALIN